ncbi:MAG: hypothetical protein GY856_53315 [bacterium]|nr:hypothetical protein [bacterium]
MAANHKKGTSPWVYIGCGCVVLLILTIGGCLAATFFGVTRVKDFVEEMEDPVKREERVRQILGAPELPEGYHAQMFFRVPFVLEMVILSDGEPLEFDAGGGGGDIDVEDLGEHVFMLFSIRDMGGSRRDVERWFEGEAGRPENIDFDVDFDSDELLGRGEFEVGSQNLRYVAHRGRIEHEDAIFAMLLIDCPKADRVRLAFYWLQLDPDTAEAPELAGTPADEAVLRDFMGHFNLCTG